MRSTVTRGIILIAKCPHVLVKKNVFYELNCLGYSCLAICIYCKWQTALEKEMQFYQKDDLGVNIVGINDWVSEKQNNSLIIFFLYDNSSLLSCWCLVWELWLNCFFFSYTVINIIEDVNTEFLKNYFNKIKHDKVILPYIFFGHLTKSSQNSYCVIITKVEYYVGLCHTCRISNLFQFCGV